MDALEGSSGDVGESVPKPSLEDEADLVGTEVGGRGTGWVKPVLHRRITGVPERGRILREVQSA